jgi:hypothetical protein
MDDRIAMTLRIVRKNLNQFGEHQDPSTKTTHIQKRDSGSSCRCPESFRREAIQRRAT